MVLKHGIVNPERKQKIRPCHLWVCIYSDDDIKTNFFEFQGVDDDSPSFFLSRDQEPHPSLALHVHIAKELWLLGSGTFLSLCLFLVLYIYLKIPLNYWHMQNDITNGSEILQIFKECYSFFFYSPFFFSHGCASIWKAFGTLHGNYEKKHHHLWRTISCPVWNKHGYCWTYCMKWKYGARRPIVTKLHSSG